MSYRLLFGLIVVLLATVVVDPAHGVVLFDYVASPATHVEDGDYDVWQNRIQDDNLTDPELRNMLLGRDNFLESVVDPKIGMAYRFAPPEMYSEYEHDSGATLTSKESGVHSGNAELTSHPGRFEGDVSFNEAATNPLSDTASFEIWFRPTALPSAESTTRRMLFESGGRGSGEALLMAFGDHDLNPNTEEIPFLRFQAKKSSEVGDLPNFVNYDLTGFDISNFVQVIAVVDPVGDQLRMYINGGPSEGGLEVVGDIGLGSAPPSEWARGSAGASLGDVALRNQMGGWAQDFPDPVFGGDFLPENPFDGHIAIFRYYDGEAFTATDAALAYQEVVLPPPSGLPGDYDDSGTVDALDYTMWKQQFGSTGELTTDGNDDGTVNAADYVIWRNNLGASNGTGSLQSASVPEPGSAVLGGFFVAGILLSRLGKRRNTDW